MSERVKMIRMARSSPLAKLCQMENPNVLYTISVVVLFLSDKFLFRIEIVVIKKIELKLVYVGLSTCPSKFIYW